MFQSGGGLAGSVDVNREMNHNVIGTEKRVHERSRTTIIIKLIADTGSNFDGNLYLSIFNNFNGNIIIEKNKIRNIEISIRKTAGRTLFRTKAYISTMGSRIRISITAFLERIFLYKDMLRK